jgi:hypothetical protein
MHTSSKRFTSPTVATSSTSNVIHAPSTRKVSCITSPDLQKESTPRFADWPGRCCFLPRLLMQELVTRGDAGPNSEEMREVLLSAGTGGGPVRRLSRRMSAGKNR